MQLSPQGPSQLQQMGGTHSFHPPEAGKINRQSFFVLLNVKRRKNFASLTKAGMLVEKICSDRQEQDEWSGRNLQLLGVTKVPEKP